MVLEATRAFKFTVMQFIQKHLLPDDRDVARIGGEESELKFLRQLCITQFLKNDEDSYYNSILQDLTPE